ncbi:hypothetical protein [Arthrobacter sp. ES1]|uniref:hypothetical protein n=1 Tax=Arthrobacter sp. ES1 TaxID=1897056 RepID=UPI001D000796|nr:hypothetical protein [Arthrobacter sp. ES1]MCB5280333.1 hypothetical protein [Arthrobacter sp. ES1]
MRHGTRSYHEVLKDKSGLSTSLVETLGGISLKMLSLSMAGGLLATLLTFWVVATSSADTSSSYQAAGIAFEKAVKESSVVIGGTDNRVGLLSDTADGKCTVQTWQGGSRDGRTTLSVDTKTVPGVCKPTTPLVARGAGDSSQELAFNIEAPVFSYGNLGGRAITFDAAGVPSLATGTIPVGVKVADWADVRPYSVKLNLATLNENAAQVTKKAELSGVTNVVNVTVAQDDLRYVPAPSTDPVPGPLRITGATRSTTVGTVYSGAKEGVTITFAGAVCPSGPTKLTASYTQQSPAAAPAVTTVVSMPLTGADAVINLGSTPNGSSGAIEVTATCIDGGVAEKASTGYTQPVPAPVLTATQGSPAETHNLSWTPVSSLPARYHVTGTSTNGRSGSLDVTGLSTPFNQEPGTAYGYTMTYKVQATVNSVTGPDSNSASISNSWPAVARPAILNDGGWTSGNKDTVRWYWAAVSCPAGTSAEYISAAWRSDIGFIGGWSAPVPTNYYDVSTWWQGYDYSVDVQSRCRSAVTGSASGYVYSNGQPFTRIVENPAPIRFDAWQNGARELITNPYTYCSGGAQLYESIVEASWNVIWIGGPRSGNTGWYVNQPGWYDQGWGVITSHITSPWNFPRGAGFQVRAAAQCVATTHWRTSGVIQQDSWWTWS